MEIVMNLKNDVYGDPNYEGGGASLCPEALRREISLPKKVPKIYAVFTKRKIADSFCIEASYESYYGKREAGIQGVDEYLLHDTKRVLAKVYDAGFRYVRIEYD